MINMDGEEYLKELSYLMDKIAASMQLNRQNYQHRLMTKRDAK